jgi:hypothetical protein
MKPNVKSRRTTIAPMMPPAMAPALVVEPRLVAPLEVAASSAEPGEEPAPGLPDGAFLTEVTVMTLVAAGPVATLVAVVVTVETNASSSGVTIMRSRKSEPLAMLVMVSVCWPAGSVGDWKKA